jgi:hypothetical protein
MKTTTREIKAGDYVAIANRKKESPARFAGQVSEYWQRFYLSRTSFGVGIPIQEAGIVGKDFWIVRVLSENKDCGWNDFNDALYHTSELRPAGTGLRKTTERENNLISIYEQNLTTIFTAKELENLRREMPLEIYTTMNRQRILNKTIKTNPLLKWLSVK